MIPLHQIQIAKPCPADWNAMTGDAQTRFCAHCKKVVYDLSQMTEAQAQALLDRTNLNVCVRIARTRDGRILTRDTTWGPKKLGHKSRGPAQKAKPHTKPSMPKLTGDVVSLSPQPAPLPPTQTTGAPLPMQTTGKIIAPHK